MCLRAGRGLHTSLMVVAMGTSQTVTPRLASEHSFYLHCTSLCKNTCFVPILAQADFVRNIKKGNFASCHICIINGQSAKCYSRVTSTKIIRFGSNQHRSIKNCELAQMEYSFTPKLRDQHMT